VPKSQGKQSTSEVTRSVLVAASATATRESLIETARRLFTEQGFFNTGTEQIVREAGVTRGALYHHFGNKKLLFLAVFHAVQQAMGESSASASPNFNAQQRLESGLIGFIDSSTQPEIQRIILVDGPAVLGWQTWQELEEGYGVGAIQRLLEAAIAEKSLPDQPVELLAHLLLASGDKAALYVANSQDPIQARELAVSAMRSLIEGMFRK